MTANVITLLPHIIEHAKWRTPAAVITAPYRYDDKPYTGAADDNRKAYIAQSAATKDGLVAPFRLRVKPRIRVKPRVRIVVSA